MPRRVLDPISQIVGGRVRARRLLIGMSQEKLGDALNVTFQQVQKYEKGTNRISASRLQQIATVLGVPIHYFYDSTDEDGSEGDDPFSLVMDHASAELLQAFKAVQDPVMRRAILGIARAAAGRPSTELGEAEP